MAVQYKDIKALRAKGKISEVWTAADMISCLYERGCQYRLADVEMALFMIGI